MTNVEAVLNLVKPGMKLGLGSGAASERFLQGLGARVKEGLTISGVPTSKKIETMARGLGIPILELADAMPSIDLAVDGADEVDGEMNMIKGYGKALFREKVIAMAAQVFVILIGPERVKEKRVEVLGHRGILPIEVVPFAIPFVQRMLANLDYPCDLLLEDEKPVITDNGNNIMHIHVTDIGDPPEFDMLLKGIPGIVETGLFIDMADAVFIEEDGVVEVMQRGNRPAPTT